MSQIPHHPLRRKTPEHIYAWFRRDLQRRKKGKHRLSPRTGERYANGNKVFIVFPDGTHRATGEVLAPKPNPVSNLFQDPNLDRESRIQLG